MDDFLQSPQLMDETFSPEDDLDLARHSMMRRKADFADNEAQAAIRRQLLAAQDPEFAKMVGVDPQAAMAQAMMSQKPAQQDSGQLDALIQLLMGG